MRRILSVAIAAVLFTPIAQAEMTEVEKKVYAMAVDPGEYAITTAHPIVIIVPPNIASTVNDAGSERELVAGFVRLNLIFTGRFSIIHRWFEFEDVGSKKRYRFFKDDTITAIFVNGSSVKFKFIGTAFQCPSGLCFVWQEGTETRPIIERRNENHPGKGREARYVHVGSSYSFFSTPYDPYDPNNWGRPTPNW